MRRDMPGLPNLIMPAVDVRDVADAHVQAMIRSGLNGQRIILAKEPMPLLNTANWLAEELNPQGFSVQTRRMGYCPIKFASLFDQQARILIPLLNVTITVDNSPSRELLGIKYERRLRDSVVEMGYSLIEFEIVPDVRKKKKKTGTFCFNKQ